MTIRPCMNAWRKLCEQFFKISLCLGVGLIASITTDKANAASSDCKVPELTENSKLLLVGAYEGSALSTVSTAGQDDVTTASGLVIEPGKDKLILILNSYSHNIWRITGAVERVDQIILAGRTTRSGRIGGGVTGVTNEKIIFLSNSDCISRFHDPDEATAVRAASEVKTLFGAAPDLVVGQYRMHTLYLPSGEHFLPKDKPSRRLAKESIIRIAKSQSGGQIDKSLPRELLSEFLDFTRGGIVELRASDVGSDLTAEPYQVLPQQAGLLQLVAMRKLKYLGNIRFMEKFKVLGSMRYPAGLAGAHSVYFSIKSGVEEPEGYPAHSCVFSEETDSYLFGIAKHCEM